MRETEGGHGFKAQVEEFQEAFGLFDKAERALFLCVCVSLSHSRSLILSPLLSLSPLSHSLPLSRCFRLEVVCVCVFEDGDGRISSEELGVVLKALGRKPRGAELETSSRASRALPSKIRQTRRTTQECWDMMGLEFLGNQVGIGSEQGGEIFKAFSVQPRLDFICFVHPRTSEELKAMVGEADEVRGIHNKMVREQKDGQRRLRLLPHTILSRRVASVSQIVAGRQRHHRVPRAGHPGTCDVI